MEIIINLIMIFIILFGSSFLFFQAFRIYQTKDINCISVIAYIIYFITSIFWLFYGIYKSDIIIIGSSIFALFGSLLILFLVYFYS